MDFEFSEEQRMLRDSVRKMMAKVATPEYVRRLDREQAFPDELYAEWLKMGLFRMPFPEEYGGLGGNVIDMVIIAEELSYKSFDLFTAYGGPVFCGLNILRKGTEEQKRHWIPKMLAGEVKFSISMSEPDAGSDIGAMRSNAKRDGKDWVINGQKLWATGAGAKNNVINVYVKTDPSVFYRKGMSLFLVDNTMPGVELRKLDMLGRRCTGTYEIFFTDVRVPEERLLGGENKGWEVVLSGLQVERITSTAGYIGGMQAILDLAVDYAKERKQFGRPIGTNQAMAHMLADMQTELEASRLMMWRAAWQLASGKDALKEISMAKLFASEAYARLANQGMQVLGAYGYNMEFDMQRHFRDARSATIGAGTSQMQRNLIAGLMGLKVQS
jgi:alkylation response protein AidB-like acyl-CoA dehydrogenase